MQNYPLLRFVKRHGAVMAIVMAVACAISIAGLLWSSWHLAALIPALLFGGVIYVLAKCFVELISLITAVLMPE